MQMGAKKMQTANEIQAIINGWTKSQIDNAHVALPGVITSYDAGSNRASVKPSGNYQAKDGRSLPYPVIYNAPVVFPTGSGGKAGVTFPIKSGDGCLIVFSDEALNGYLSGNVNPGDPRHHSMNDAIVIPGLYSGGATSEVEYPNETCMTCDGSLVRLDGSHLIISLKNGTTITIDEGLHGEFANGTELTISAGDLVVSGISHCHHVHSGVEAGPDNSGEPVGGGE